MLHRYLILHGLQKLIPANFREKYPELAVGRRRRRQDVAADEEAQIVSAVGLLESSLWSSETWARSKRNTARSRLLKTWNLIFKRIYNKTVQGQGFSKIIFVIIF